MLFYVMNDQPERREGLKALLRQIHRQSRMSDVSDWAELERLLGRGLPDLLVIDWQMSAMTLDALRALRAVREAHTALAIAVLTDEGGAETVGPLVRAGALGVIPRDLEPRLIVRAFEIVLLGGYYVPVGALGPDMQPGSPEAPALAGRPLSRSERADRAARLAAYQQGGRRFARAGLLSPRQQQITRLVHLGNTNKTIARALNISEGTVKIHLAAVFHLLGAANRAAAVALYNGWQHGTLQALRAGLPVAPDLESTRERCPTRPHPRTALSGPGAAKASSRQSAERAPPYLIAAQPDWPFAAPRRRAPRSGAAGAKRAGKRTRAAGGAPESAAGGPPAEGAEQGSHAKKAPRRKRATSTAKRTKATEFIEAGQSTEVSEAVEVVEVIDVIDVIETGSAGRTGARHAVADPDAAGPTPEGEAELAQRPDQ